MKVTVFDYGAGNLHSLTKAIAGAGREVIVERDPVAATKTDFLVLPGVGAFGPAAEAMAPGLSAMRASLAGGLPCIGICLGMQLMFDESDEGGGEGLGVFSGRVTRLHATRVPQIGWNALDDVREPLVKSSGLETAYYANAFVCRATESSDVVAWSTHDGDRYPAVVRRGATLGVQFHPEKSSAPGVRFLNAFIDEAAR